MSELDDSSYINTNTIPERTSPDWQEYVMSKFYENELEDGNPKHGGLRRVAELLVGEIVNTKTVLVQTPCKENDYSASCVCSVTFQDKKWKTFEAVGNAHRYNTDKDFFPYTVAIAETRAKSRVFRSALGLDKVSADETSKNAPEISDDPITSGQIKLIDNMCQRHDVNLKKFVNSFGSKHKIINTVSHETAVTILKKLNEFQQTNGPTVDPKFVGYDKTWKSDFYQESEN